MHFLFETLYLAFGDAVGTIHLLTAADESSKPFLNGFQGQPAEWADVPEPPPAINFQPDRYTPIHEPPFFLDTSTPLPASPIACRNTTLDSGPTTTPHMRLSHKSSEDGEIISATKDEHRFRSGREGAITTAVSPTCFPLVQLIHTAGRA